MIAFLKRHFLMTAAAAGLAGMMLFVLVKEAGAFGGEKGAASGPAQAVGGGPQSGAAGAKAGGGGQQPGAGQAGGGPGAGGAAGGGGAGRPALVALAAAEARSFSDRLEVPGTAFANESITVTAKVQDIVERVLFESGQSVDAGQVLIVLANVEQSADVGGVARDVDAALDDADGALQEAAAARADADAAFNEVDAVGRDLEAARASVAEAEAVLLEARLNLGRVQTLAERGFAAKARLDSAQATVSTAEARLRAARERVAGAAQRVQTQRVRANALTARAQSVEQRAQSARSRAASVSQRAKSVQSRLNDRTIRAPFAGVVGLRNISPGQLARPGEALATLDDVSQIRVDFDVPEANLGSLRPGMAVAIRPAAVDGQVYRALVRFVDTRIDPRTRTVKARAYIPNPDRALKPGMLMAVDLLSADRSMPAVPEVALQEEGTQTFVFVAERGERGMSAKRTPVTTGVRRNGFAEITSGLAPGTLVVVEGLVRLRDGQPIRTAGGDGGGGGGGGGGGAPGAAAPAAPAQGDGPPRPQAANPQRGG